MDKRIGGLKRSRSRSKGVRKSIYIIVLSSKENIGNIIMSYSISVRVGRSQAIECGTNVVLVPSKIY